MDTPKQGWTPYDRCLYNRNLSDCLVNEMLYIQDLKPTLNVQSDSLRAKVFM